MGWRPEEDDGEEHKRSPAERVGDSSPADEHRHAACHSAPDDVLLGTALEHDRVEDDVEQDRPDGERRGQRVGDEPQDNGREDAEGKREDERLAVRELTRDEWSLRRALHEAIDVTVDVAVERVCAPRRHRTAEHHAEHKPEVRHATLGEEHRRDRRDEQELDDPGLRQRHICPSLASERRPLRGCDSH